LSAIPRQRARSRQAPIAAEAAPTGLLLRPDSCQLGPKQKKGRFRGLSSKPVAAGSALTSLETGVALADHEHFAATANDFAVTVTRLRGLQRGKHLHGQLLKLYGQGKTGL
jgi:hypothetical protein